MGAVGQKIFDPGAGERGEAQGAQFSNENVRDDGVECRAIIHKEHPGIALLLLQMSQHSVQSYGDGVLCGSVCSVSELVNWSAQIRTKKIKGEPPVVFQQHENLAFQPP